MNLYAIRRHDGFSDGTALEDASNTNSNAANNKRWSGGSLQHS
jgi:hypothetical protein